VGQTSSQVRFLSQGAGFQLFLTANGGAVYSLARPESGYRSDTHDVFRLDFPGASSNPAVSGLQPLPSHSNYLVGNNPANWYRNVSQYDTVQYSNLYPNIDLVYHSHTTGDRQLEWDLVVRPGADISVVRLNWQGLQSVSLDSAGNLVLQTAGGQLVEKAPVLYQQDAAGRRHNVAGRYLLLGGNQIGFRVGAYDHGRPLVIDPTVGFATYLGGSGDDSASGIVVDSAGSAYVVGNTTSTDFPTTLGVLQGSSSSGSHAFVSKLNATGTGVVYSTYLGGSVDSHGMPSLDKAAAVAVGPDGSAYVTGWSNSVDFTATPGAYQTTVGTGASFVAELNPSGSALTYLTFLGDSSTVTSALALDAAGNAYVAGKTGNPAFPTTAGAFQTTSPGLQGGPADSSPDCAPCHFSDRNLTT
jgi:hypothetical protein